MSHHLADDPKSLASVVQSLGGSLVPHENLRFEMPVSKVREIVPRLEQLGIGCKRISERVGDDVRQCASHVQGIVLVEAYRKK